MQITHVETYAVRVPLVPARRMITAYGLHDVSDYVLVRVGTDSGLEGAGEATVSPRWSGETVWGACALIEHILAPAIIGCDPCDIRLIDRRMAAACSLNWFTRAALEMACWDLYGKQQGRPVCELLGGARRPQEIRSRYSLGAYAPDEAASRAAELVAAGFTTIKVKVGTRPQDDLARVRAVRAAIGPEPEITIDGNGGWDTATTLQCLAELAECRLTLIEQPTPAGDHVGLAEVRRATDIPIMADESCFDLVQARQLAAQQACDVLSIYPGKQAGIARAQAIVDFAATRRLACSIGSNLELDVATAAMAHLVVACPNMQVEKFPGDLLGPSYHEFSLARTPVEIRGPVTLVPSGPGLGVEVDWALARQHPVPSR